MQSDSTRKSGTVNPATSHFETAYSTLATLPLPLPSLMRIILVTNSHVAEAHSDCNILLEKAFHQLASLQPNHEWIIAPASPGKGWSLFGPRKAQASVRKLSPDLVLCLSA